jgi:arabinofuranosyltransferase
VSRARITQILLIASILLFTVVTLRTAWVAEDAYITFRTVDNFVNGYGLTWNTAERVQAYTHPLWMFLLSFFCLFTREVYFTSIFLCVVLSLLAVTIYAFRTAKTQPAAILGVLLLVFSKAFTDYSTSGLENALTHLLLVLYLFVYLEFKPTRKKLFLLTFITALAALCRPDTILLYLPALLYCICRQFSLKPLWVVVGFLPLVLWEVFSIIYYGFPFPNSAYAKLNTGIPRSELLAQGIHYVKNSLFNDPLTLSAIAIGTVTPFFKQKLSSMMMSFGILLYLFYIVFIGGDFMSGRFLTAPLLCAVVLIFRERFEKRKNFLPALFAILLLGFLSPQPPIFSGADYHVDQKNYMDDRYITDERGYYFQSTGLFKSDGKRGLEEHPQAVRGRKAKALGEHVTKGGNVGFFGYYAGPEVHILDGFALAEPLLARLPVRSVNWRVGHFIRRIPSGYFETLASRQNKIRDPGIAAYYDRLYLITRGKLFDGERLAAIWKMNTGQLKKYVKPLFHSRRLMDKGIRSLRQNKPDEAITHLEKSVAYDSTRSASWAYLTNSYMRMNRTEEAIHAVLKSVELDPIRYAGELLRMAKHFEKNGKAEVAILLYRRYLEINPDDAALKNHIENLQYRYQDQ